MDALPIIIVQAVPTAEQQEAEALREAQLREVDVLHQHGRALINAKLYPAAIATCRRALTLAPDSSDLWGCLGAAYHDSWHLTDARRALERAVELNPDNAEAQSNLALTLGELGNVAEAEHIMRALMEIPEQRKKQRLNLSLMLLYHGDWQRGLDLYEERYGIVAQEWKLPKFHGVPYWEGEDLTGKTLYVQTEQGIGDTILFSRFIPWVKATWPTASIKLCCNHVYSNLLWEFRDICEFIPTGTLIPEGDDAFDYGVYLHSLARHANARADCVAADPGLIRRRALQQQAKVPYQLQQPLRPARKVGICWTGNPEQVANKQRSVPLETLLYLTIDPDNVLYSLQCGPGQDDIARLGVQHLIEDLNADRVNGISQDLVVCASAMLELDVVVTCCTSIAHLAGALGVPCFVMLCHEAFWAWGRNETLTAWYPSVRLFRQKHRGDWTQVVTDVAKALKEL
jgi:tetratricopeptide (TPR) repeat protein